MSERKGPVIFFSEEVLKDSTSFAEIYREIEREWWQKYNAREWQRILTGPS